MPNLSGVAAGYVSPLRKRFEIGPFTARLAPTIHVRRGGPIPRVLHAGLLTHGVDPDGLKGKEMSGDGYARTPVELSPFQLGKRTFNAPFRVSATGEAAAEYLGLWDDDRLMFCGILRAAQTGYHAPTEYDFPAYSVVVLWPRLLGERER